MKNLVLEKNVQGQVLPLIFFTMYILVCVVIVYSVVQFSSCALVINNFLKNVGLLTSWLVCSCV